MSNNMLHVTWSMLHRIPGWFWITLIYLATHLPGLLALPVFADEAIYIRWAQLIIDEPLRFAFFSMSDGKPPLFMWILSLTLRFFSDPLLAGRLTSLTIGLLTVFAVGKTACLLTGNKRVELLSMSIVMFAPFWWFYHRMALMDGLLTLFLTLAFYFALHIAIRCQKERGIAYDTIPFVLWLSLSFGGALLTKTPALFAIPVIAMTPIFSLVGQKTYTRGVAKKLKESLFLIGIGGVLGCVLFLFLRISPFFGTLFARSSDFTFTITDLMHGEWKYVLFSSFPREVGWISQYMTIGVVLASIAGLFSRNKKIVFSLLWFCIVFALPLIVLGRVLYPRYFLPVAPLLTIAAAIGFEHLLRSRKTLLFGWILCIAFALQSLLFSLPSIFNVARIPFVAIDRIQYLTEWSAGFGNREVRDFIRHKYSLTHRPMTILTEGAFGTLPDGLLMYFVGQSQLEGVEIHGIGVGPSELPKEYVDQRATRDVYYVVNSHRMKLEKTDTVVNILETKRPNGGPSLVLYSVK